MGGTSGRAVAFRWFYTESIRVMLLVRRSLAHLSYESYMFKKRNKAATQEVVPFFALVGLLTKF